MPLVGSFVESTRLLINVCFIITPRHFLLIKTTANQETIRPRRLKLFPVEKGFSLSVGGDYQRSDIRCRKYVLERFFAAVKTRNIVKPVVAVVVFHLVFIS